MRLFLAIELPPPIQQQVEQQLTAFRKDYPDVIWVTPENMHLTLHFFGEVSNIEEIKENIERAIYDCPPTYVFSFGADLFIGKTIVLYIILKRDKIIERLVEQVHAQFPHNPQKRFVPHITIGRYRIPSKQQYYLMKKKIQNTAIDIEFPVDEIVLFESIISGHAPVYKKLAEFPLLK